jgi:LysM repeat protein
MDKRPLIFSLLFAGTISLACHGIAAAEETQAPAPGCETAAEYTVKQGDTLWGISGSKLSDPFKWEKVWKDNPSIKDPDFILPGEKIKIVGGVCADEKKAEGTGEAPSAGGAKSGQAQADSSVFVRPGRGERKQPREDSRVIEEEKPAKAPIATEAQILSAGFILDKIVSLGVKISGSSMGEKEMYSQGDDIFIKASGKMAPGERYLSFNPGAEVKDPVTGKRIGTVIEATGVILLKEKREKFFLATVETNFSTIGKEDSLMLKPSFAPIMEPTLGNTGQKGVYGFVAAIEGGQETALTGHVIYITIGSKSGVKAGDVLDIKRTGKVVPVKSEADGVVSKVLSGLDLNMENLPEQKVGEGMVLSVQDNTATVKVSNVTEQITPGYRVVYKN